MAVAEQGMTRDAGEERAEEICKGYGIMVGENL